MAKRLLLTGCATFLVVIFMIVLGIYVNIRFRKVRDYQYSPLKDKVVTLVYNRDYNNPNENKYYLVPGKYWGWGFPTRNYVYFRLPRVDYPFDNNYIIVNWYPNDRCNLKVMYFPCDWNARKYILENKLSDSYKLCFSKEELLDSGEVFSFPKHVDIDLNDFGGQKYSDESLDRLQLYLKNNNHFQNK